MAIREELVAELRDAIKTRDKARSNAIRQIETDVAIAKSAPGFSGEVDDGFYQKAIASYVKKMEKARAEYAAAGARGAEQEAILAFEVEYLSQWLPKLPGEDETRDIVRRAMAELGVADPKMAGRVTGHVMKSGQQLDGGLVNRLVREELEG
ncbi:MAG: GatB/YqeY domain-containing protein [Acidimicrobiia bacterium]